MCYLITYLDLCALNTLTSEVRIKVSKSMSKNRGSAGETLIRLRLNPASDRQLCNIQLTVYEGKWASLWEG